MTTPAAPTPALSPGLPGPPPGAGGGAAPGSAEPGLRSRPFVLLAAG